MRRLLLAVLLALLPGMVWAQQNPLFVFDPTGATKWVAPETPFQFRAPVTFSDAVAITGASSLTNLTLSGQLLVTGSAAAPAIAPAGYASSVGFSFGNGTIWFDAAGAHWLKFDGYFNVSGSSGISFLAGAGTAGATSSVLEEDGAGILVQRNANSSQYHRVSGGYSSYSETGSLSEEITLATGGVTTDSTANLLPANSIIEAVVYRVTVGITTAVNFSIGDATTAARFVSGATGVAADSTGVGLLQNNPDVAAAAGPVQASAAKVRITTNANPGAGKIRVIVYYRSFAVPAS